MKNLMLLPVYVNYSAMDTSGSALVTADPIENINAVPNKLIPVKFIENKLVTTFCVKQTFSTWLLMNLVYSRPFMEPLHTISAECQFKLNSSCFRSSLLDYGKLTMIFLMVAACIWRIECSRHCTVATEYINRCVA